MNEIDELIVKVAKENQMDPAALLAVKYVEVGDGTGFYKNNGYKNIPTILFEGHIFFKYYNQNHPLANREELQKLHPNVYYPKWDRSKYLGGVRELDRLKEACDLDRECGLVSASWGIGQIMGFNYKACNCETIQEFVNKNYLSVEYQLKLWVDFLSNDNTIRYSLKKLDWTSFARRYNGNGQVNYYADKLKKYYNKFIKLV